MREKNIDNEPNMQSNEPNKDIFAAFSEPNFLQYPNTRLTFSTHSVQVFFPCSEYCMN